MASLSQHKKDCLHFLGQEFEAVHVWLDEYFSQFGPYHRRVRHHYEGATQVAEIFGEQAKAAAIIHILRDCRHVPSHRDYDDGYVDALGLKRNWSTAAYIRYNDQEFEDLVREHLKPTSLVLWAFLKWEDARNFLAAVTTYLPDEIESLEEAWKEARARLENPNLSLTSSQAFSNFKEVKGIPDEVRVYLEEVTTRSRALAGASEGSEPEIGYISIDTLTNPFICLDYDLLEDLKPELTGTSPLEIARFAFPESVTTSVIVVGEPTQRGVTFVSRQKTIAVSNVRLSATPNGTEVSYMIGANPQAIVVSDIGDRFVLRNGIHRAFLLAQLGQKEIPCILIKESGVMPLVTAAYPTFAPGVLIQPRQPLLVDFLRPEFCLQAPMRRTHKVIRISADETLLPID